MKYIFNFLIIVLSSAIICTSSFSKEILVKASKVQLMDIYDLYDTMGECVAIDSKDFSAKVSGTVNNVTFKQGDIVSKGTVIIKINESIAEALLENSLANMRSNEINYNRDFQLYKKGMCSEKVFQDSKKAYTNALYSYQKDLEQYNNMIIKAPFEGYLGAIKYKVGDNIKEGDYLFNITDKNSNRKQIFIYLPEKLLKFVSTKTKVAIENIDTYVHDVSTNINPDTGNFIVKILIISPNSLVHGSTVKASLRLNPHKALVVEEKNVLQDNKGKFVYKIGNKDIVNKAYITTGLRFHDLIEITSNNLAENTLIVSEGLTKVSDGMTIKIID